MLIGRSPYRTWPDGQIMEFEIEWEPDSKFFRLFPIPQTPFDRWEDDGGSTSK